MVLITNIRDKYIKAKVRINNCTKNIKDTIEVIKSAIRAIKKAKNLYNEFVDQYSDENKYQEENKYESSKPQSFIDVDYVEVN